MNVEPLPPPPFPPPPVGEPARKRRWLGFLALAIAAALLLVNVPIALERGRSSAIPTGPHAFLEQLPGGAPYRWNPCQPIHYVVNQGLEPSGAAADISGAIARVSEATGIRFVDDGSTVESADQQIGAAFQTTIPGPRYLPLLITFVSQQHFGFLADTTQALAFGMPYRGDGDLAHTYVSGVVVVDVGQTIPTGFGSRFALGPVLMHELAHVMGLGHVGAADELMWSPRVPGHSPAPDLSQTNWGPGDLQGLRMVGRSAGCLPAR